MADRRATRRASVAIEAEGEDEGEGTRVALADRNMTPPCRTKLFLWLAGALLLAGCDDSVSSQLTVNGAPFEPTSCRTGQDREFLGADLQDDGGRTLRLVVEPDDTATIILIPEEGKGSVTFKGCGVVSVQKSDNDKYGQYTVDGSTDLRCHVDGWSVVGSATFSDCGEEY